MARIPTFTNKVSLAKTLANLAEGKEVSRFLSLQLVEKKFVTIETVKHSGRGRPMHKFVLTGKGRGYVALSRNWKAMRTVVSEVSKPLMLTYQGDSIAA